MRTPVQSNGLLANPSPIFTNVLLIGVGDVLSYMVRIPAYSLVIHILVYSLLLLLLSALLLKYEVYVEILGAVSGMVEATLALP